MLNPPRPRPRLYALLTTLLLGSAAPATPPGLALDGKVWFNNPTFKLNDSRKVVLLVFHPQDRTIRRSIRELNRLAARDDTVVVGLTSASPRTVDRFIRAARAEFTIGAASAFASRFDRRKLPIVYVLTPAARRTPNPPLPEPHDLSKIEQLLPRYEDLSWEQLNALEDTAQLTDIALSSSDSDYRKGALRRLHKLLSPEAFLDFAEQLAVIEPDPWVRGQAEFLANQHRGENTLDESFPSLTTEYAREMRENPDDPKWVPYQAFAERADQLSVPELTAEYWDRVGSAEPADLLVRRTAITHLRKRGQAAGVGSADRKAVRNELLRILAAEPDFSTRLYATIGLGMVARTGDREVVEALLEAAAREPHLTNVRPTMEYAAFKIATGSRNTNEMPPGGMLKQRVQSDND